VDRDCIICGFSFIVVHRRGRPQVYCSVECRRLAEYEVGRLNRRLETLESRRSEIAAGGRKWEVGMLPVLDQQIDEATARLRALITRGKPPPTPSLMP
jgi:sugar-specific transcriptional regulator TrmB